MPIKVKSMCYCGLFIAITAIGTMVLHIPVPATNGYIHLGDGIILLIAFFFGWRYGLVSAALGSALADLLMGYAHWALFTMVIKGLMALVAAYLSDNGKALASMQNIAAIFISESVMVFGYFLAGWVLMGNALVSLTSVPANGVQALGGIIIFAVAAAAFKKSGIVNYFKA